MGKLPEEYLENLVAYADAHEPPPDVRVSGTMAIFTRTVRRLVSEIRESREQLRRARELLEIAQRNVDSEDIAAFLRETDPAEPAEPKEVKP